MDVIADLAIACAQQTSRRQTPCAEADPCYELFRRALARPPDEAAWHALVTQYGRLVRHWLGDYADDDACQEVFVRFWKALHSSETPLPIRFPTTGAILQYLKQCVLSVRIELGRAAAQQAQVEAALRTAVLAETTWLYGHTEHRSDVDDDFQQVIAACLQTPQEQVLFDLRYHYHVVFSK